METTEEGAISTTSSSMDDSRRPLLVFGKATRAVLATATVGLLFFGLASSNILNSDLTYNLMSKVKLTLFHKHQQQQSPVKQQHKPLRQQLGEAAHVTADEGGVYFNNEKETSPTGLSWIMSYPLSGAGEVADLVSEASGTVVAANSIGERQHHKQLFPALSSSSKQRHSGPWLWLDDEDDVLTLNKPTGPILTNTYCGSHCGNWCPPERFLDSAESFLQGCTATTGLIPGDGIHGRWELVNTHYSVDQVQKIVHLIDHPLANIVARFENEASRHGQRFAVDFPDTANGFQDWCRSMDENDVIMESALLRDSGWLSQPGAEKVPCLAEFIKYVHWHNLAFEVANTLVRPTVVVHRGELKTTSEVNVFDSVALQGLLDFLELPNLKGWQLPGPQRQEQVLRKEVVATEGGGSDDDDCNDEEGNLGYLSYFTNEQKDAIRTFLASAASDQTWLELMRYDFD